MRAQLLKAVLVCLLVATSVLAQTESKTPAEKASKRVDRLKAQLNLSPEQTAALQPILEQEMAELRAIREKHPSDAAARSKEMKTVRERYDGQIAAVLTPEQQAEWSKIKEQRGKTVERFAELQSRLKLTPEQSDALQPILEQEADELRAIKEKHASDTSRGDKKNMLSEMKGVQERYEGQIAAVLTSNQMSEWKKIKAERREEIKQSRGIGY
jgi:Spy/CpxP family protein refolding chaperone